VSFTTGPTLFIGALEGEIPRLLREGQCGYSVPVENSKELAMHILALQDNSSQRQQLGLNARALFDERFDQRIGCSHWATLLDDIQGQ